MFAFKTSAGQSFDQKVFDILKILIHVGIYRLSYQSKHLYLSKIVNWYLFFFKEKQS